MASREEVPSNHRPLQMLGTLGGGGMGSVMGKEKERGELEEKVGGWGEGGGSPRAQTTSLHGGELR